MRASRLKLKVVVMCPCPSLWNRKVLQMATLAKRTRVLWLLCNLELFKGYCTHCRLEHWFSASGSGSGGHTHIHMHNTFFNLEVPVEVAAECQPDFFCFFDGGLCFRKFEKHSSFEDQTERRSSVCLRYCARLLRDHQTVVPLVSLEGGDAAVRSVYLPGLVPLTLLYLYLIDEVHANKADKLILGEQTIHL